MNKYNPDIHHRRSIRLKGYDYSQAGLYFITTCCKNRVCLFGEVVDAQMILNDAGKMIEKEWLALVNRFTNIYLHEHIVMPNHFHGILEIMDTNLAAPLVSGLDDISQPQEISSKNKTIGDMMDAFKSITTVEYIRGVKTMNWQPFNKKVWQRNYYEHIIRNEKAYQNISNYILNNPAKWEADKFNPINPETDDEDK